MSQLIGVVLAGGVGKRLGAPKGELQVGGRAMAERAAMALWPVCGSVLISVAPGRPSPVDGFDVVEDSWPAGRGPLAGIAAAFARTGKADLFVLACDYPRVDSDLVSRLVELAGPDDDLVIAVDPQGRDHPLVALWRRRAEAVVREALDRGYFKVAGLLADLRVRRAGPDELSGIDLGRALLNVNTPDDLSAADAPGGATPRGEPPWPI